MVRSNSTWHSRRSSSSTSTLTTTPKHRRSTGSLASSSAQSHQQHTYHYITQSALRQQQMLQNERDRAAANNNTNDKSVRHTRSTSNANATASNVSSNPNPPRRSNNPFTISSTQSDTPDSSRATSPQNQRHLSTASSGIGGGLGFSGGYASLGSGSRLTLPSNASPTHAYFQSGHGRDASASTGAGMSLIGNGGVGASRSGSSTGHLAPLNPFSSSASASSHNNNTNPNSSTPDISLAVNYFPSKFSAALLDSSSSTRRRKPRSTKSGGGGGGDKMDFMDVPLPKQGGGVDAFRANSDRIPGMLDEDEDAEEEQANLSLWTGGKTKRQMKPGKRQRWNKFKWTLLFANIVLTVYTLAGLVLCLLTWFNVFEHADVLRVANRPELIISTIATSFGLFTSLLGYAGILLNNRRFLATYTFLTWLTFAFLVIPGYIACRRREYNLEGKLNLQWSRDFGTDGRARIQNELDCCGYFSPFVEATVTQTCYSRSTLPGCKLRFLKFERKVLMRWYEVVFGVVPIHVGVMVVALLCSNHVTYRFGKGMMPKRYRLSMNSMAVIMENYASQLAERYGTDFASDVMARSQSNLHLDMSNNPFTHYISNHSVSTIQSQSGPAQVYGNGGGGGHGQSHGYGDAHGKVNGNGSGFSYGGGGGSGGGRGGGKGQTHTPTSSFGSGGVDSSTALTHASSRRPAPGFQMRVDATIMQ